MPDPQQPFPASLNGDPPWWIKALKEFGFPTLIAGALMWFFLTNFQEFQRDTSANIRGLTSMVNFHVAQMRVDQTEARSYWRLICINTARTAQQQAMCTQVPTPTPPREP